MTTPKTKSTAPPQVESEAKKKKLANDKKAAEGRTEKKKYWARKEKVYEFEKTNQTRVVVFRSTDQWWKIGGHSALFYYHQLMPRFKNKRTAKLRADTDYYNKFKDGVVLVGDIDSMKRDMMGLGLKIKHEDTDVVSFLLDKEVSEETLQSLKDIEAERMAKINQIAMPHDTHPMLYKRMVELQSEIYPMTRKMQPYDRQLFGKELMMEMRGMLGCYVRMTHEKTMAAEMLRKIADRAGTMTFLMQELAELGLVESKRALRLAGDMLSIKQMAVASAQKEEAAGA